MTQSTDPYLDIFADYLKSNGLKMTRQRRLIVATFLATAGHFKMGMPS